MPGNTLVRRVMLQISADDGDTEGKLDRISAKADELKGKHPELAVRIDTAAASAKLGVLRAELKDVAKPVDVKIEPKLDKTAAAAAQAQLKAVGSQAGGGFLSGFNPTVALWTTGIVAALAALPAVAAAAGAAAGIALGAALLIGTKKVQGPLYAQFQDMFHGVLGVLRTSALPLVQPLAQAFAQVGQWAKAIKPELTAVFASLGPLVMPLAKGLESVVSNVLPGFLTLMKAAQPAVSAVSALLGTLSQTLGATLASLAPGIKASSSFLGSLGQVARTLLPVLGTLASRIAQALAPGVRGLAAALTALLPFIGRALGDFARLAMAGSGPLMGMLARLAPMVARLGDTILKGLEPLIPAVTKTLQNLANTIGGPVIQAIAASMPSLQGIVSTLLNLLDTVLVPLLPSLGQLAGAVINLTQNAFVPLLPPTFQLLNALASMANSVIPALTPALNALAGFLTQVANAAAYTFSMVSAVLNLVGISTGSAAGMPGGISQIVAAGLDPFGSGGGASGGGGGYGGYGGGGGWASGQTGGSTGGTGRKGAQQPKITFSRSLVAGLTGTAAQIKSSVNTILGDVTREVQAGMLGKGQGSAITRFVEADSDKLQQLAGRRAAILKEIAAAKQYAAGVTSTAEQGGLMAAAGAATPQLGIGGIMMQLQADLGRIREFRKNLAKLRRMGLNKAYLDQLIQAGPVAGGAVAAELAAGNEADIRAVNKVESQIGQAATSLGKQSAEMMFDSGKQAGKGFLSGLLAQEKQLQAAMKHLADVLVQQLKKDLKIHSPSQVARELARAVPDGIVLGIEDGHGDVTRAAGRLGRGMLPGGGLGGYGGGRVVIEIRGDAALRQWLKKSIRVTGGDVTVVGA